MENPTEDKHQECKVLSICVVRELRFRGFPGWYNREPVEKENLGFRKERGLSEGP